MSVNPNFPESLDIKPLHLPGDTFDFDHASQAEAIRKYGIAGRVWEAAYALKTYVQGSPDLEFDPPFLHDPVPNHPTILELGSGTGIVAAALAETLAGTPCTLFVTDLPEVCPLLERNLTKYVSRSAGGAPQESPRSVFVRPLAWGSEEHARQIADELPVSALPNNLPAPGCYLTHIICSDLVYFPELLAPLLRTLIHVTSPPLAPARASGHLPKVIISYKIRSLAKETAFWSAFGLWFSFEPVLIRSRRPHEDQAQDTGADNLLWGSWARFGSAGDNDMYVFVASRRPESFDWVVALNDQALLSGVGARGTGEGKGDDTFEQLLLMQLDT